MAEKLPTSTKPATGWTREFPSQVGNYWFRTPDSEPLVIEVSGGGLPGGAPVPFRIYEFGMAEDGVSKEEFQGEHRRAEYLGPIAPASSGQLAALRDASTRALYPLEYLLRNNLIPDDLVEPTKAVATALRKALNLPEKVKED